MNARPKILLAIICGTAGIAAIGLMSYTPEFAALYEKQRRVEAACDQLRNDSASDDKQQITRTVCEKLKAKVEAEQYSNTPQQVARRSATSEMRGSIHLVTLEPIVVNLAQEGREQYLRTRFDLKVQTQTQAALLSRNMNRIRSRVTLLLTGTKASEIDAANGQKLLASSIITAINQPFDGESDQPLVTDVVFTSFKIQD
jgi:flagellar basal body-associated protein FliL